MVERQVVHPSMGHGDHCFESWVAAQLALRHSMPLTRFGVPHLHTSICYVCLHKHLEQFSHLMQQSGKLRDGHGRTICRTKGSIHGILLTHKFLWSHETAAHGGAHGTLVCAIHLALCTCHRQHRISSSEGTLFTCSCNAPQYCRNTLTHRHRLANCAKPYLQDLLTDLGCRSTFFPDESAFSHPLKIISRSGFFCKRKSLVTVVRLSNASTPKARAGG